MVLNIVPKMTQAFQAQALPPQNKGQSRRQHTGGLTFLQGRPAPQPLQSSDPWEHVAAPGRAHRLSLYQLHRQGGCLPAE